MQEKLDQNKQEVTTISQKKDCRPYQFEKRHKILTKETKHPGPIAPIIDLMKLSPFVSHIEVFGEIVPKMNQGKKGWKRS